jgi:hypothetical protein
MPTCLSRKLIGLSREANSLLAPNAAWELFESVQMWLLAVA